MDIKERNNNIVHMYENNIDIIEIAKTFTLKPIYIKQILKNNGISLGVIRSKNVKQRRDKVLELHYTGLYNHEIAKKLCINRRTVSTDLTLLRKSQDFKIVEKVIKHTNIKDDIKVIKREKPNKIFKKKKDLDHVKLSYRKPIVPEHAKPTTLVNRMQPDGTYRKVSFIV